MSSRQDSSRNPKYFKPWTLALGTATNLSNTNLATAVGIAQPPSTDAYPGEVPFPVIDCRFQRGMSFSINTTVLAGATSPVIEPRWSVDGVNFISFSTTVPNTVSYSLTITATGPNGYNIDNPWFPWLQFVVITGSGSGGTLDTASISWSMRD